jgi:hypothetical protein
MPLTDVGKEEHVKILAIFLCILAVATVAYGQTTTNTLTPTQCVVLKNDIFADATLTAARDNRQDQVIADAYNANASPVYYVWKSKATRDDIMYTFGDGGTKFDTAGTGYVTRTLQEIALFESVFNKTSGMTNPMNELVRDSFANSMSGGTAPAPANRTHMQAVMRRVASRGERLFVDNTTQPCTGGTANKPNGPCLMTFEGPVLATHIACALNLP